MSGTGSATRETGGRYQLLSVITPYHAETPSPDASDRPRRESQDAADDAAAERESGSELRFHPAAFRHVSFHICLQSSKRGGGRKDPHMWVLKACGFITWSASITVNLLNLTIWNIIAHATYSLPTGHHSSLPRHSPVREHSGYISFIMWSIGQSYAKCRNRHPKSFFGHIFWTI